MRKRLSILIALATASVIAVATVIPAFATTVVLQDSGSCLGTGGSTYSAGAPYGYTTTGCDLRYADVAFSYNGSTIEEDNPGFQPYDLGFFGPTYADHVDTLHNLCTTDYSSCNGYVESGAAHP